MSKKERKIHPFEKKLEALIMLRDNNYNLLQTSNETGVSRQGLKMWKEKDSVIIYGLIDKYKGDLEKVNEEEFIRIKRAKINNDIDELLQEDDFMELVRQAKNLTVKKMMMKIKSNRAQLKDMTDALKVLHSINDVEIPEGKKPKSAEALADLLIKSYNKKKEKPN